MDDPGEVFVLHFGAQLALKVIFGRHEEIADKLSGHGCMVSLSGVATSRPPPHFTNTIFPSTASALMTSPARKRPARISRESGSCERGVRARKRRDRASISCRELPGANPLKDAHAALDAAVLAAYGFSAKADLLAQLLALNQQVAAKLDRTEPVTAPGIPAGCPQPETLLTEDGIRPAR